MSHPNPHSDFIHLEYFEKNIDFAKSVWMELEKAKDECSSWWVKQPAFIKYPILWKNGYMAKKAMKQKPHGGARKGAGRKPQEPTVVMRIPVSMVEAVKKLLLKGKRPQPPPAQES